MSSRFFDVGARLYIDIDVLKQSAHPIYLEVALKYMSLQIKPGVISFR